MTMTANPLRVAASPYARRLARETGRSLLGMAGSGPGGRIVARDLLAAGIPVEPPSLQAIPAPVAESKLAVKSVRVRASGALAASVSLQPVNELIAAFAASGISMRREDIVNRAVASLGKTDIPVQLLHGEMLRPVAMPLPEEEDLHLTACLDVASEKVEMLLTFAMPAISPDHAAALIAACRDDLLNPLRLFA